MIWFSNNFDLKIFEERLLFFRSCTFLKIIVIPGSDFGVFTIPSAASCFQFLEYFHWWAVTGWDISCGICVFIWWSFWLVKLGIYVVIWGISVIHLAGPINLFPLSEYSLIWSQFKFCLDGAFTRLCQMMIAILPKWASKRVEFEDCCWSLLTAINRDPWSVQNFLCIPYSAI